MFTEGHIDRALATILDGRVTSVATIASRIGDRGQITNITREEMLEQIVTFKSGALPADLDYVQERTVGASLGKDAVRSGVIASIGGLALVVLFMIAYYGLAGLNALASIALNLLILLALVAFSPVTMTLPGIAGLILLFGGEALRGFAFTMLVGIVSGTYSTVVIAPALATRLSGRQRLSEAIGT